MFRTNLVVHRQKRGIIYCITQFGTIVQESLAALKLQVRLLRVVGKTLKSFR